MFQKYPETSHSNYLYLCCNLLVKFVIFLKSSLLFNSFYCPIVYCLVYEQNFTAQ